MIPSHMRYNSPAERKAERGDSDGRETARKAGLGKRLRFLLDQRFHKTKRAKVVNNNNNANKMFSDSSNRSNKNIFPGIKLCEVWLKNTGLKFYYYSYYFHFHRATTPLRRLQMNLQDFLPTRTHGH